MQISNSEPFYEPTSGSYRKEIPSIVVMIIGTVIILALYSPLTKPLWIDEFLHFALGSHHSTSEAWNSIVTSIPTINHGQTGVYMMLNYWTMKLFGANLFLLRLPSLLSAAFMILSYSRIALRLKFGPLWLSVLFLFIIFQTNLISYANEARPYMPLAAATAGVLAFYMVRSSERNLVDRCWGAIAIGLGVISHPYFAVYWFMLALFTFFQQGIPRKAFVKAFLKHCDLLISVPATLVFFGLAKFTWLLGSPEFHMDPFFWIRPAGILNTFMQLAHFQFLGPFWITLIVMASVYITLLLYPGLRNSDSFRQIFSPLCLILCALAISALLGYVSYLRDYWVLPRQWMASMGLCCFAVTWLLVSVSRWLRTLWSPLQSIPLLVILLGVAPSEGTRVHNERVRAWAPTDPVQMDISARENVPKNNDEWVALANANLHEGGPVWLVFREYYIPSH